MNIFVSGPMRGFAEFNFPEFARVTEWLRSQGHTVFSPAEHELTLGFDPTGLAGTSEELEGLTFDLRRALRDELTWLLDNADCVVVLDGWDKSSGARAEVSAAKAIGVTVLSSTLEDVDDAPILAFREGFFEGRTKGYSAGYKDCQWDVDH